MKLEIGGGSRPKGDGWVNLDAVRGPGVDVIADAHDLPYPDGSVEAVYSSHALEHCHAPLAVLREIARVCRLGAPVEIRVPHEYSPMAMCPGHRCVISEQQVLQWCRDFARESWRGSARRLELLSVERVPSGRFAELKQALGALLTDEQVLRFVPDACHEYRFRFVAVDNRE